MLRDVWFRRLCLIAGVILALAVGLGVFVHQHRERQELLQTWSRVDAVFRQATFSTAESQYKELQAKLLTSVNSDDPRVRLATDMQKLCSILARLQLSLGTRDAKAVTQISELRAARQDFLPQASGDTTDAASKTNDVDAEGLKIGLSFGRKERWDEVLKWLDSQGQRLGQSLLQQDLPNANTLAIVDSIQVLFDRSGHAASELKVLSGTARQKLDYKRAEAVFAKLAVTAEASLAEADVALARGQWSELRRQFGTNVKSAIWTAHRDRLRQRLIEQVRASSVSFATAPSQPTGRLDLRGPEVLPKSQFAAFTPLRVDQVRTSSGEVVFVRNDDRCYALDAATGETKWICRVGYDMRWLPQRVGSEATENATPLVLVPWERAANEAITLAAAADLSVQWTWHLPPGAALAGPPVVVGRRLFVGFQSGELWELHLESGKPRAFLTLPQSAGGPLAVSSDGRGAALIDRQLAVYIIDFAEPPRCRDVVLPEPGENTLDAWVVWMWPFLLVFENELTDRCRIIVLREGEQGFEEVQRETIVGRLWQPPVVKGQSFLLASDLGWETVQSLQLTTLPAMFTVFQQPAKVREWPRQPQLLSHPDAPFVAAMEARVQRYAVNPLEAQVQRQRELLWEHVFPLPDTVPSQALQSSSHGVVAVGQSGREAPPYVHAIDFAKGQLQWEARVGNHVVDAFALNDNSPILLRTATGDMFRRSPNEPDRLTRLARVKVNDTVDYSEAHYSLGWVEGTPPEFRVISPEGSNSRVVPLTHPAIAPVAFFDGQLTVKSGNGSATVAGPWAAILDSSLRLQLKGLGSQAVSQFAQLSRDLPAENWWRPLWLDGKGLLLSHTHGDLVLYHPDKVQQVVYPREVRKLQLKAGLASRPVWSQGLIWVSCGDDHLRVFDPIDLELRRDIGLADRPSSRPAVGAVTVIGLKNGHVAIVKRDSDQVSQDVTVSKRPITYVALAPTSEHIWAIDSHGEMTELEASGKVVRRQRLSGAASAAPVWYRGEWLVPTTAGELARIRVDSQ